MLSNDAEARQNSVTLRYSTSRSNRTKFQPYDPFTLPQTPKPRSRPISPEIEPANVLSPFYPSISRPDSRDGRASRSRNRSTTLPSSQISSPPYKFRNISSPLPIRGSNSRDTPKDLAPRGKAIRDTRTSRSRSPMGRYKLDYDSPLSQSYPPLFSRPLSPLSPNNYRFGYGGLVDPLSNGSLSGSPRPRYRPRPYLRDLSSTLYSTPNDQLSPNPEFSFTDSHDSKPLQTPSFEDSQFFSVPKSLPRSNPTILFHGTSDAESRHTPEMHSIPPTSPSVNSKHEVESQAPYPSILGGDVPMQEVEESQRFTRFRDYIKFSITDTLPRQLYLLFLFRLPALYFMRVARIFEEADLTPEEIGDMAVNAVTTNNDGQDDFDTNPAYGRLKKAWELLITRFVREWETFNVVSVLLLPAIVTMFQVEGATDDPVTRYIAFWSLICALLSSLYDCLFIICFPTMRKPHKAAAWAYEALKSQKIFWNVWVMLAMPAVWMCWSILTFIICIMSFMWRSRAKLPDDHEFTVAPSTELGMRIFICVVLGTGVAYGLLIFTTLNRFGAGMDKAWRLRANAFFAPAMPRTTAASPPEYRVTEEPVVVGPMPGRNPDRSGSGNPSRDHVVGGTRPSTSHSSNLPPAYPPSPNPPPPSEDMLKRKSATPSSSQLQVTKRTSERHRNTPSGTTDIRAPRSARSISPRQRPTSSGSRHSDVRKNLDGERGRSPIGHSRSRLNLQNRADDAAGMSRVSQESPQVRGKRSDNKNGPRTSRDSFLLDFSNNDGEILLHEIHDRHQARPSR